MNDKVISIGEGKLKSFKKEVLKITEEAHGLNENNSNVSQAFDDCIERNKLYRAHDRFQEKQLLEKHNIGINECHNMACKDNEESNNCGKGDAVGCIFRMTASPPNSLNYEEYMPSHREALDMLEKHGLLNGDRKRYEEANALYNRAHNNKERNNTKIENITIAQLRDCIFTILKDSIYDDFSLLSGEDVGILSNNITLEVEKAMGVYPNIRII